ncbi:MAG: DUF1772 domain-containing protein [Chloroflexota bacterium]
MNNNISKLLALTFSSAFGTGCLLISVVLVESWRHMEPAAFVDWFSAYGSLMGVVQLPIEALGLLFTLIVFIQVARNNHEATQKVLWFLALIFSIGAILLLPLYFAGTNTILIDKTIDLSQVADEVERWGFWNWVRTGLSFAAAIMMLIGMAKDSAKP